MTMTRPAYGLRDDQLQSASGGVRIGQGEGWGDWFRRQVPGDWRTEEQKLNDFQAWDDWNRANGLPGAFGEPPRLKGDETFLNPREVTQDNLFGVFPEELRGLKDLRDGRPDGSGGARPELDAFIKEAEENKDSLDIRSFGRPGYDPDAGLPKPTEQRADAPFDGTAVATASFDPPVQGNVETAYADASYQDASYQDASYADASYADASAESFDV